MTRAFRLGFSFLEAMAEPEPLFDDAAKLAIEQGGVHLVSVQYAATKAVLSVTEFLQVGTVIYGQTIARGQAIINNADHLGLDFEPFKHDDANEERLSGFTLKKKHGKKHHLTASFYDKLIRVQQMHQESTLSLAEAQTVDQSVREDITAHSSFILTIVNAARKKLANMDEADRKFFDVVSPEQFLQGTPMPTIWWLQRAIYVLSHKRRPWGLWVRNSFATWLVPYVDKHVLHLDVVASITVRGYHALLALNDEVAAAWRTDPKPGVSDWAGRLARIAGCKRSTVYNRREEWWQEYGVDIKYSLHMYSDILYFGHNSIARPESITEMMVALHYKRGDEVVRLHAKAIADFERKRVQVVNPALVRSPRAMELNLPPIPPPSIAVPITRSHQPVDLIDLGDIDHDDLDQAFPGKPVPTQPTVVSSVLKAPRAKQESPATLGKAIVLRGGRAPAMELKPPLVAVPGLDQLEDFVAKQPIAVGRGLATKPRTKVLVMRGTSSPPPPEKKVLLMRVRSNPPPKTRTKVIVMRGRPSPPRPRTDRAQPDRGPSRTRRRKTSSPPIR